VQCEDTSLKQYFLLAFAMALFIPITKSGRWKPAAFWMNEEPRKWTRPDLRGNVFSIQTGAKKQLLFFY